MTAPTAHDDADRIRRLMQEGLDHYALGEADRAIACWRQVLRIDADHADARDYLRAAEADGEDAPPSQAAPAAAGRGGGLLDEAVALLRRGDLKDAIDLLDAVVRDDPDALEAHAFLDLTRAHLVRRYRERVGSGEAALRVRISAREVMKYNLPSQAGFLLSRIDGGISIDELLSVSGMDPFDALRALASLLDAGIVEARA